ncbi:hypothetical protein DFH27DRAFT_654373 [Peziza echinospora]|nr:hypothetical protein DFH27DRAFT_654373 [Peziza echinospora]
MNIDGISATTIPADGKDYQNYHDQITVVSQRMINDAFERLYKQIPGAEKGANIAYENEDYGKLEGVLECPRIGIPGGGGGRADEAYYLLRIKKALATLHTGHRITMDWWVLAIRVPLGEVTLSAQDQAAYLSKASPGNIAGFVPGDYTARRIFYALSTASWERPDEMSTCGKDGNGNDVQLADWRKEGQNEAYWARLGPMWGGWAGKQAQRGISPMGIAFGAAADSSARPDGAKCSYPPAFVVAQARPYLQPPAAPNSGGFADGNCLVFCENVQPPRDTPGKTPPPPRAAPSNPSLARAEGLLLAGAPRGAYVLDSRAFLKDRLMLRLQALVRANRIVSASLHEHYLGDDNVYQFNMNKLQRYVALQAVEGGGRYAWALTPHPLNRFVSTKVEKFAMEGVPFANEGKQSIIGNGAVSVRWSSGANVFRIEGTTAYEFGMKLCPPAAVKYHFVDTRDGPKRPVDLVRGFKLTTSWSISLSFSTVAGKDNAQTLKFAFGGINPQTNLPTNLTYACEPEFTDPIAFEREEGPNETSIGWQTKRASASVITPQVAEKAIFDRMKSSLADALAELGKLAENGQLGFVYPGSGDLDYRNPRLNLKGDLVADIEYLGPSKPGGSLGMTIPFVEPITPPPPPPEPVKPVPPPQEPVKPAPVAADPTAGISPASKKAFKRICVEKNTRRLRWNMKFKYTKAWSPSASSGHGSGKLSLFAKNETTREHGFNFIRVSFLPTPSSVPAGKNCGFPLLGSARWRQVPSVDAHVALGLKPGQHVYTCKKEWQVGTTQLAAAMSFDASTGAQVVTVRGTSGTSESLDGQTAFVPFSIPVGSEFTIDLYGSIHRYGVYAIRIHESWEVAEGRGGQGLGSAVGHLLLEVREDGTWVSDGI